MPMKSILFPIFVVLLAAPVSTAQGPGAAPPEATARWQDMRFGMFIHWGPAMDIEAVEVPGK